MQRFGVMRSPMPNRPVDSTAGMVMIGTVERQVDGGQRKDCDEIEQGGDSSPLAPRLHGGSSVPAHHRDRLLHRRRGENAPHSLFYECGADGVPSGN
jgi:hypothetical protein